MKQPRVALLTTMTVLFMSLMSGSSCWAGFVDAGAGLPGVSTCRVAWGDYDNDGDLDIALAGSTNSSPWSVTNIYRNDNGTLTNTGAVLPASSWGSLAWGDYDNDGDLDLAIVGNNCGCRVYRNDGGTFTDAKAMLAAVYDSSIAWGDYDNDGDLDLALAGYDGTTCISKVYRNDSGAFTDIGAGLVGVSHSCLAWGDYDNDGDLDLALAGRAGTVRVSKIYRNDDGLFTDSGAVLANVDDGDLAWGDYDNDGDLDLAIAGTMASKIYRNDAGSFSDTGAQLLGVSCCGLAWGDYDNDGDLDLAIAGSNSGCRVYRNDNGTFVDSGENLADVWWASVAWGDYDRDGDLDLLVAGDSDYGHICKLYRNDGLAATANTAPTAPTGLTARCAASSLILNWSPATDAETPTSGLSYNIRIGSAPGGSDVFSGMANASTGLRNIPALGNAQQRLTWTLRILPSKSALYCSVQAIDTAYAGSAWSTESIAYLHKISGHVCPAASMVGTTLSASNSRAVALADSDGYYELFVPDGWSGTVTPAKAPYEFAVASRTYDNVTSDCPNQDFSATIADVGASLPGTRVFAWGDYDSDGDLDLAVPGKIYRNDNGTFTDIDAGLTEVPNTGLAWGDYDNDGDLDLVVSGNPSGIAATRIYRNDSGAFNESVCLSGVFGDPAWGDYDNDGDLDLAVADHSVGTRIYRNTYGMFADTGVALIGNGGLAWGDYDNDGDLDLATSGYADGAGVSKIYRNDNGVFVDAMALLAEIDASNGSISWGDYDSDGDLDLAIAAFGLSGCPTKIYRNDNGTFVDSGASIAGVYLGSLAWGDYDNDGDLDLAIAGSTGTGYTGPRICKVYRNDGGSFVDIGASLVAADWCTVSWADYDNDGKLELTVAGSTGAANVMVIYRFDFGTANTPPSAPTGLSASYTADGLALSWQAAVDAQTPSSGLSYNIRAGSTPGGCDVFSGMASAAGIRRLSALGNAQKGLAWTLRGMRSSAEYFCSVQAIDSAGAGSAWATESIATGRTISGHVYGFTGVTGVVLSANNGGGSAIVDSNGDYGLCVPVGWSGTVAPSKTLYWFEPASKDYDNVTSDLTGQDFDACTLESIDANMLGITICSLAWGDYDNDGDLDLAAAGSAGSTNVSRIYRNDSGVFTDSGVELPGVLHCSLAWGDYDSDGDLDLALAGSTESGAVSKVYRNDAGSFTDIGADIGAPLLPACSLAWGDYDNDGDLDLAIAGFSAGGSKVYRNDSGTFTDTAAALPSATVCSIAWGDYDNDGDLDIAMAGVLANRVSSKVYRNDNGTFTDIGAVLTGVRYSSLAWGDYDNDGDLDLAIAGSAGSTRVSKIYRNDAGTFYDSGAELTGVQMGSLAWGDFDSDGDLDLAVAGMSLDGGISKIYRNTNGAFEDAGFSLPGLYWCSLAWGDYDNDGRLDLAMAGAGSTSYVTSIYKNVGFAAHNTAPSVPGGLSATLAADALTLSWNAATDAQTPALGLSYNVRVGSAPGECDVFSGMADPLTGLRQLPAIGNACKRLSWTVKNTSPTRMYYCSVQAIDTSFVGSAWAGDISVGVDSAQPSVLSVYASPALVAASDPVHITVNATDNTRVESVTAEGIALTKSGSTIWTGDIPAAAGMGLHSVVVAAADGSANLATDSSASYRTTSIYGLTCGAASHPLTGAVFGLYLFKVWGKVTIIDLNSFWIDDGSTTRVRVIAPGYSGIADGDYVSARGILDPTATPITLTCPASRVDRK